MDCNGGNDCGGKDDDDCGGDDCGGKDEDDDCGLHVDSDASVSLDGDALSGHFVAGVTDSMLGGGSACATTTMAVV